MALCGTAGVTVLLDWTTVVWVVTEAVPDGVALIAPGVLVCCLGSVGSDTIVTFARWW